MMAEDHSYFEKEWGGWNIAPEMRRRGYPAERVHGLLGKSDMQNQKQRFDMPDELLPLWGAIAWRYRERLDSVDGAGFVATKDEADSVFAELREIAETEKSLED
jgi:hypothetical protein